MGQISDEAATTAICPVCHRPRTPADMVPGTMVRRSLLGLIGKECPDWTQESSICLTDLNRFRTQYVQSMLEDETGALSESEAAVVKSIADQELLSKNINEEYEERLTFGQKVSDRMASFGGSWPFIFIFLIIMFTWIGINTIGLFRRPFDPYPYILLNLVLSCLAAIQAPIIMMSQNRQSSKDRMQAEHDYQVNLKAELEIRSLHEKLDQLRRHQWQRLLEIQQVQMDLMEEMVPKGPKTGG